MFCLLCPFKSATDRPIGSHSSLSKRTHPVYLMVLHKAQIKWGIGRKWGRQPWMTGSCFVRKTPKDIYLLTFIGIKRYTQGRYLVLLFSCAAWRAYGLNLWPARSTPKLAYLGRQTFIEDPSNGIKFSRCAINSDFLAFRLLWSLQLLGGPN